MLWLEQHLPDQAALKNLLLEEGDPLKPNHAWSGDFTPIWAQGGLNLEERLEQPFESLVDLSLVKASYIIMDSGDVLTLESKSCLEVID